MMEEEQAPEVRFRSGALDRQRSLFLPNQLTKTRLRGRAQPVSYFLKPSWEDEYVETTKVGQSLVPRKWISLTFRQTTDSDRPPLAGIEGNQVR